MNNINKTINDIKNLKIQGATNVAKAVVTAAGLWSQDKNWTQAELAELVNKLKNIRPTEPLAQNSLNYLLSETKKIEGQSLKKISHHIIDILSSAKKKIINHAVMIIKNNSNILTHCHSSTVTGILIKAKNQGKQFKIYLTETRPRYQGHLTAHELTQAGINSTLITDSEASYIISKEDTINIDLILLGADALDHNGSAFNKVGSYSIGLSAKKADIPLYVTATLLKYSPQKINIEVRSPKEVWDKPPVNLKILNLAFDKIPAEFITAFVTEKGLIKPKDLPAAVYKSYPWLKPAEPQINSLSKNLCPK